MGSTLLLHICCGPCSIMPVKLLQDEGFEVTGWFMNPNIQPLAEYLRRRDGAQEAAARLGIKIIFDDVWDLAQWLTCQLPRKDSPLRCEWCCTSRLEAAAIKAKDFDFFSTSLLYSIYQPHDIIAAKGRELSDKFVYRDFRKYWQQGFDLSRQWQIYRQPYCGCVFSENERYAKKLERVRRELA